MPKKVVFGSFGLLLLMAPLGASADTLSDLQALIATLQSQIQTLSTPASTPVVVPAPPTTSMRVCPALTAALSRGSKGGDVANLQAFLSQEGAYTGDITAYFGPLTEAALRRWQSSLGIVSSGTPASTGWGVAGPKTRALIRSRCGNPDVGTKTSSTMPPVTPLIPAVTVVSYPPSVATSSLPRATLDQSSLSAASTNPLITGTAANVGNNFFISVVNTASSTVFESGGIPRTAEGHWQVTVTEPLKNGYYRVDVRNGSAVLASGVLRVAAGETVVDLKVNGIDGSVTVSPGSLIVLSWILRGVSNCTLPVYGVSQDAGIAFVKLAQVTNTYKLTCTNVLGVAVADTVVVNVSGPDALFLSTNKSSYMRGDLIRVTWKTKGVNYPLNWIALVPAGARYSASTWPNAADAQKSYTSGVEFGEKSMTAPQTIGTYEIVLYLDDSFTELARSAPFTVGGSISGALSISVSESPASVAKGQNLAISWSSQNALSGSVVLLRLVNAQTGSGAGIIARAQNTSGNYTWTVPTASTVICPDCAGMQTVSPGSYKISAEIYTPSTAWLGDTYPPPNPTYPTFLATATSSAFAITAP